MSRKFFSKDERQRTLEKAIGLTPKPIAVESSWDANMQGWALELWAIQPEHKAVLLACLQSRDKDFPLVARNVQPRPEIEEARFLGRTIAEALGVEYYSAPDEPSDAPRWWDNH